MMKEELLSNPGWIMVAMWATGASLLILSGNPVGWVLAVISVMRSYLAWKYRR